MKNRKQVFLIVRVQDTNEKLCVVRPSPEMAKHAIELSLACVGKTEGDDFHGILRECSPYLFVGFMGKYGTITKVVNENGLETDSIIPGDSFVTLPAEAKIGDTIDFRNELN